PLGGWLEVAPTPFVLLRLDGAVEGANAIARRLFYAVTLPQEPTVFSAFACEHRDVIRDAMAQVSDGATSTTPELRLRTDDGTARWVRLQCTLVDDEGRPRLLVHVEEVSERRREREYGLAVAAKLRGVLDAVPDSVFVVERGRVTLANVAAVTLLGSASTTSLEGVDFRQLLVTMPDELAKMLQGEPMAAGQGGTPVGLEIRRPDGQERFAQTLWLPMASHGRGAWLCVGRDLTNQRALRAKLAHSERLASIGVLASGVAHEINNPLQYVMEFVQQIADVLANAGRHEDGLLLRTTDATELSKMLDQVAEGTQRVARIVQDIKGQARDGDHPRAVDIKEVVKRALELAGPHLRYDIRLVPRLATVPPVLADPGRMMQVVLNLLINASQAVRGRGEATIEVDVERLGSRVCVVVRDNGPGVAPTARAHVFEPFFTTKGEGDGSGLGLYLCRQYVREYGGEIELLEDEHQGACFRVWLPVHVETTPRSRPDSGPQQAATLDQRRAVVLVVDDEASVRLALQAALRGRATVIEASGATAGIERIRQREGQIDAILCDLLMPGGSGAQLHAWVHEHHPELRAHLGFMTGGAFTPQTRRFLDEHDPPRLEKPFSRVTLNAFIARLIAGDASSHGRYRG
ncbi:MAG: PAS domain-containing protein, partial [Deltaproteobacteria bacterium]|nr:PAS domain-containing protein [Deltaproteobacteria bacterium]